MRPFISTKRVVQQINQLMFEEHQDNQFNDSQVMRSYSSGIIDGLGLALNILTKSPEKDAYAYPISLSFYEEDEPARDVEAMRERMFDLQQANKLSLFYEEVD